MHRGLGSFDISNPDSELLSDIFWVLQGGDHRIPAVFVMGIRQCFLWIIRVTLSPLPFLVHQGTREGSDGLWQWNKAQAPPVPWGNTGKAFINVPGRYFRVRPVLSVKQQEGYFFRLAALTISSISFYPAFPLKSIVFIVICYELRDFFWLTAFSGWWLITILSINTS